MADDTDGILNNAQEEDVGDGGAAADADEENATAARTTVSKGQNKTPLSINLGISDNLDVRLIAEARD